MLYNLLKGESYDAVTTFTINDALTHAKREPFDLYILDTRYPDGTGSDLCRDLRELLPGAKVIFYSGAAYETDRQSAASKSLQYFQKYC